MLSKSLTYPPKTGTGLLIMYFLFNTQLCSGKFGSTEGMSSFFWRGYVGAVVGAASVARDFLNSAGTESDGGCCLTGRELKRQSELS